MIECHSIDAHKSLGRCYLNSFKCQGATYASSSSYKVVLSKFAEVECSGNNLDMHQHPDQCYKQPSRSGWSSGYPSSSNAVCLDERSCLDLCDSLPECHSIDMHHGKPRCYLNSYACQGATYTSAANYKLLRSRQAERYCSGNDLNVRYHTEQCYEHPSREGWDASYGANSNALCLDEAACGACVTSCVPRCAIAWYSVSRLSYTAATHPHTLFLFFSPPPPSRAQSRYVLRGTIATR
jgi:hypothetical protein